MKDWVKIACGSDGCTMSIGHDSPAPPVQAERLRQRRVRLGLSQADVEGSLYWKARRLNELEHGREFPLEGEWRVLTDFYKALEERARKAQNP